MPIAETINPTNAPRRPITTASALRLRCRDPRCMCKLPEAAEPRRAFCARGCYTHFFRTRCKVCGEPSPKGRLCSGACRYAHKRNPEIYAFRAVKTQGMGKVGFNARGPLTSLYKTGIKARAKSFGPTLSDDSFWLASLPMHPIDVARVRRANDPERIRQEAAWGRPKVKIGPDVPPLNLIGGWRFPRAPMLDEKTCKAGGAL
jgi:hypothetical protein